MRLEVPARLKAREALVEKPLAPLIVGEDTHRVVVAELVDDQAEAGAAVHDHHREFGAAAFDTVDVGDLGPGELAVERVEPGEGGFGAPNRDPVPPRCAVAGLVEDVDDDVAVTALFVVVIGIQ